MHMQGTPQTMQHDADYGDVVAEVTAFLRARLDAAERAGIGADRLVVDPGIGFGKTAAHNLELLGASASCLGSVRRSWSAGRASRRSRLVGVDTAAPLRSDSEQMRVDAASAVAAVLAVERGARIVRVHAVRATVAALAVWRAASGAGR